jgi:F-type H+-transporting ATPase subunit delta
MKITESQYAITLYELTLDKTQKDIDSAVLGLAEILHKKNQMRLLPRVIEKFNHIWNKNNGIVEAEVISREELSNELRNKLRNYLSNKYKAKEVVLNNIISESIKGGIIIRVGDEVLDGSVERQLNKLRNSFIKL